MLQINQLLSRFKTLTNSEKLKKERVVEILTEKKFPITIEQISLNKEIIFIKVSPIIKTEILLRKEELMEQIKRVPGLEGITTIQ